MLLLARFLSVGVWNRWHHQSKLPTRPRTATMRRTHQTSALLLHRASSFTSSRLSVSISPQAFACSLLLTTTSGRNVGHGDRKSPRSLAGLRPLTPPSPPERRGIGAVGRCMMGTKKSLHPMTIQQKIKLAEQRESQARMAHNMKRDRLKDIMGALAGPTGELQTADLLLAQKLAKIDLPEEFLLKTPYAQQYSGAGSDGASPRAIKVQPFYNAIDYEKMQHTEEFLEQHALREQKRAQRKAAADALAAEEAAKAAAAAKAAEDARLGTSLRAGKPQVGDDELRRAHAAIKARLSSQFGDLRLAFRAFDQDGSGRVTRRRRATLNTLNLGLPRRITQALVDIADFDCDGDISFAEFARVLWRGRHHLHEGLPRGWRGRCQGEQPHEGTIGRQDAKVIKDGVTTITPLGDVTEGEDESTCGMTRRSRRSTRTAAATSRARSSATHLHDEPAERVPKETVKC